MKIAAFTQYASKLPRTNKNIVIDLLINTSLSKITVFFRRYAKISSLCKLFGFGIIGFDYREFFLGIGGSGFRSAEKVVEAEG